MSIVPSGSKGISPWIGWGISTLLLLWMNRKNRSEGDTTTQQPSKFTEDTGNQIGNCIPVVMGRTILKNPLISFYGDYSWRPYTEEYGMHSELNAASLLWPILLSLIPLLEKPTIHKSDSTMTVEGPEVTGGGGGSLANPAVSGYVVDNENGRKNAILTNAIIQLLIALLLWLFNRHAGRTTIQKGFKYYLGWQNILCWTGDNFGLKRIWIK